LRNSIEYKLNNYIKNHNEGEEPINKCFNDIFGIRIVLENNIKYDEIKEFVDNKYDYLKCIDSSKGDYVATHIYFKSDYFFKDVVVVKNIEKFIKLINNDRELIGIDVAKYILSKIKCSHLKLEKLVYMCFAEYLCNTGKELFKDKIYAYKFGPVVKSVYDKYRKYGYKDIETEEINSDGILELPAKSRILFAIDGLNKMYRRNYIKIWKMYG